MGLCIFKIIIKSNYKELFYVSFIYKIGIRNCYMVVKIYFNGVNIYNLINICMWYGV